MPFDVRSFKPGRFLNHRNTSGAAAADSSTINTTNFPLTAAFNGGGARSVWVVWNGTGGTAIDTITIQPLIYDSTVSSQWNKLATVTFTKDVMQELYIYDAGVVFLRINAVTTTATAIQVNVALADSSRVE